MSLCTVIQIHIHIFLLLDFYNVFLKLISQIYEILQIKPHSEVMGWVRARMAFAILCVTNLCLRGSRVKWRSGHGMDDGAGLPHFSH